MKNIFKLGLIALLVTGLSCSLVAQKKIKEGSIKFELTKVEPSSPETDMMQGSRMEFAFNKKHQKMEMSMMGGLVEIKTYNDLETENAIVLTNMMGNKIKVEVSKEEAEKQNQDVAKPEFEINIDKSDTKEIIGYQCFKAILKDKDGNEINIYCTDEIQPRLRYFSDLFPGLEAFPMEYSVSNAGIVMVFSAIEFAEKLSKDAFKPDDEGYTSMTLDEFQKQMGAMGGMGF